MLRRWSLKNDLCKQRYEKDQPDRLPANRKGYQSRGANLGLVCAGGILLTWGRSDMRRKRYEEGVIASKDSEMSNARFRAMLSLSEPLSEP